MQQTYFDHILNPPLLRPTDYEILERVSVARSLTRLRSQWTEFTTCGCPHHLMYVKDIGLPESLHPTTNARRYMVAAGVAETATWDPCVELPSPAASRQLRDELLVGSSSVGGPWGSGPRWLRPSGPRGRGPPAGWAPLAGRQPGSTDYLDTETLIHGLSARRFLFMSGFFIVLLDRERSKVV